MGRWYTRPMMFVIDVEASVAFYVDRLGFTEAWSFRDAVGSKFVSQVDRDETEIILSSQWPDRVGKGMLFIELVPEDWKALPAAFEANGVPFREGWWGYRSLIVTDPDGNELYFPDPDDQGGDRWTLALGGQFAKTTDGTTREGSHVHPRHRRRERRRGVAPLL